MASRIEWQQLSERVKASLRVRLLAGATLPLAVAFFFMQWGFTIRSGGGLLLINCSLGIALGLAGLFYAFLAILYQHRQAAAGDLAPWQDAYGYAWGHFRRNARLLLWVIGAVLVVLFCQGLLLFLARIPGLGILWLGIVIPPLVIFNSVLLPAVLLALAFLAVQVTAGDSDAKASVDALMEALRHRRNLFAYGMGVLLLAFVMILILAIPVWVGWSLTMVYGEAFAGQVLEDFFSFQGFWGHLAGMAHDALIALIAGALFAFPCSLLVDLCLHECLLAQDMPASDQPTEEQ